MHKIQNWESMSPWLKFFVVFIPICAVIMLGIGVRDYLSGDLNRDYFFPAIHVSSPGVFNVWDVWSVRKNREIALADTIAARVAGMKNALLLSVLVKHSLQASSWHR